MNIDVSIKRIDNGYVVTDNDNPQRKMYYASLKEFATAKILEELNDKDKSICEQDTPAAPFSLKLVSDL